MKMDRKRKMKMDRKRDRLSELPNDLIRRILSYLDTKWVVRTSVLSKRWEKLYISVRVIDLESKPFKRLVEFRKFVRSVLSKTYGGGSVDSFRFFYHGKVDNLLVKKVVNFVVTHKVKHLFLQPGWGWDFIPIPQPILECKTFKTLQLRNFDITKSFGFTTLTSLYLEYCPFTYGSDCFDLLQSFPNLNTLSLIHCDLHLFKILKVRGPQLVSLKVEATVYSSRNLSYRNVHENLKIEICAPKLTSLTYRDYAADFTETHLPSLQQADIHVRIPFEVSKGKDLKKEREKANINMLKLFQGIRNSHCVKLSYVTIEALNEVTELEHQPSPFKRLKSLEVTHSKDRRRSFPLPAKVANYLFSESPCAKTIIIPLPKERMSSYI